MVAESSRVIKRWTVLVMVSFAYFVMFPDDLPAVLGPIERLLNLTNAVSPWFYGVVAVGVISLALTRIFARTPEVR